MSEEKKRGRGGKRTGSGRPRDALKGERFPVYLSGNDADLVRERAKEEGITPYSWIAQTIRRVLWGKNFVGEEMRPPETIPEQMLRQASAEYPGAWQFLANCRRDMGTPSLPDVWPDWCYCPMASAHAWVYRDLIGDPSRPPDISQLSPLEWTARMSAVQRISALAAWRMGKGIYRFDPSLASALIATPLEGRIPVELLYRLPEWCVYIEAPAEWPGEFPGFFAHLEYDANTGRSELRLLFADDEATAIPLHMQGETIQEMVDGYLAESQRQSEILGQAVPVPEGAAAMLVEHLRLADCLNLILYLCNSEAEYSGSERPRNPVPVKTRRGPQLFPSEKVRIWELGESIGEQLRRAESGQREGEARSAPSPHLRRAHWHSYWVGKGRSEIRVRWLHPIMVGYKEDQNGV